MQTAKHGRSAWLRLVQFGLAALTLTAALSISSVFAKAMSTGPPAITSTSEKMPATVMQTAVADIATQGDIDTVVNSTGHTVNGTIQATVLGQLPIIGSMNALMLLTATITTITALCAIVAMFGLQLVSRLKIGGVFFSRRLAGSLPQSLRWQHFGRQSRSLRLVAA